MSARRKAVLGAVAAVVPLVALALYLHFHTVAVLQARGTIAAQERSLLITATLLGLLVIVPVYILTVFIAWKYRVSNKRTKKYTPGWASSRWLEAVWWGIPLAIVTVLSVVAWRSSYALDPFKPLSGGKPLTIQVVALDWKWLFIYPEQQVASVNLAPLPVGRPITFRITSDTVMNSFWIPQLSGQIYAMPGMSTALNLMAGKPGDYYGSSANISGNGFAGMHFTARAEDEQVFNRWAATTRQSAPTLSLNAYNQLARPSKDNPAAAYRLGADNLFDYVVMKYMVPGGTQ